MTIRVSDYIAQRLAEWDVKHVFMLSGGGMMHLMDAAGREPGLDYVCNHHEHACAVAAEGYARQKGALGVCYATSGPGATNTITGVVECYQDSVPVLFISGQAKRSQTIRASGIAGLRQFGTFEVDIISIVEPITKYAVVLDAPEMVRYHLEKAYHTALTGRPGPVFIDIPVDVQGAPVDPESLVGYEPEPELLSAADATVIDGVIERLRQARRPLILAGHGVRAARAAEAFQALVQVLNVPVATTQMAADLLPYEDALYVGHPGMKGDRPGNFAVQSADVILTLGCSLHVLTTGYELDRFAPDAYKIQVELDPAVREREQVGVDEKIPWAVETFIEAMAARLGEAPLVAEGPWHVHCRRMKSELAVMNEPHAHPEGRINYYDLNDALSELCREGDTIVADSGSAFYVIGQAFRVKRDQRVIVSGALGAMGHALPLALGASLAARDRRVVCVVGDGSLQTNLQELATLRHHAPNVKLFVVNNDGYVSIRNTQTNFFDGFLVGTSPASGVTLPSLEKVAAAYGIPYIGVRELPALRDRVAEALEYSGPVICEVFTAATQDIIPTVSSFKREDGSMESKPLHDMYPFMPPAEVARYLDGSEASELSAH